MANPEFDIKRPTMIGDTSDNSLQKTTQILRGEGINKVKNALRRLISFFLERK